jgi:hypothetical protein
MKPKYNNNIRNKFTALGFLRFLLHSISRSKQFVFGWNHFSSARCWCNSTKKKTFFASFRKSPQKNICLKKIFVGYLRNHKSGVKLTGCTFPLEILISAFLPKSWQIWHSIRSQGETAPGLPDCIGTAHRNGENIPNHHKTYKMVTKYTKWP